MKKIFQGIILNIVFVFTGFITQAQPGPGMQAGGGAVAGGPIGGGAPIDSGVVILLAIGVAYGAYKLYQMRSAVSICEKS